jgi:hypothetical protein
MGLSDYVYPNWNRDAHKRYFGALAWCMLIGLDRNRRLLALDISGSFTIPVSHAQLATQLLLAYGRVITAKSSLYRLRCWNAVFGYLIKAIIRWLFGIW